MAARTTKKAPARGRTTPKARGGLVGPRNIVWRYESDGIQFIVQERSIQQEDGSIAYDFLLTSDMTPQDRPKSFTSLSAAERAIPEFLSLLKVLKSRQAAITKAVSAVEAWLPAPPQEEVSIEQMLASAGGAPAGAPGSGEFQPPVEG
jgi:hypothetical protein